MDSWLDKIVDDDFIKESLTFTSLFIAVYENMLDYVTDNIKELLCNEEIKDGMLHYTETESYKAKIKHRPVGNKNKPNIALASFLWLVDNNAISAEEYQTFLHMRDVRNRYAHELLEIVYKGFPERDIALFGKMVAMYRKISNWWFVNIEAPILGYDFPDNADISNIQGGLNCLIDTILEVLYNNKSEEYKKLLHELRMDDRK